MNRFEIVTCKNIIDMIKASALGELIKMDVCEISNKELMEKPFFYRRVSNNLTMEEIMENDFSDRFVFCFEVSLQAEMYIYEIFQMIVGSGVTRWFEFYHSDEKSNSIAQCLDGINLNISYLRHPEKDRNLTLDTSKGLLDTWKGTLVFRRRLDDGNR